MTRAGFLARLRRLEQPRTSRAAMERELADLVQRYLSHTDEDIEAMSDAELDELFALHSAQDGPFARIDELRRKLGITEWGAKLTQDEIDALFAQ